MTFLPPAHGRIGVKSDAADARIYMEKLRERVLAGLKAGKSVRRIGHVSPDGRVQDWQQYGGWRELNVRGMARFLKDSGQAG